MDLDVQVVGFSGTHIHPSEPIDWRVIIVKFSDFSIKHLQEHLLLLCFLFP